MAGLRHRGDATEIRDDLGQLLKIPYYCRWPGCPKAFETKRQRAGHMQVHGDPPGGNTRKPIAHGTVPGFWQHRRHGVTPCAECRAAWAAHNREQRRGNKNIQT